MRFELYAHFPQRMRHFRTFVTGVYGFHGTARVAEVTSSTQCKQSGKGESAANLEKLCISVYQTVGLTQRTTLPLRPVERPVPEALV